MNTLKELYWIHAPSSNEHGIQGYIRKKLYDLKIPFKIDNYNQTYNLKNKNQPLIVAHTDQVGSIPISKLFETNRYIKGDKNLGADDKNGIWILLELLKRFPDTNFIFSTEEEIGGNVQHLLTSVNTENIPFAIVFDRKGSSDIIGHDNKYCSDKFEKAIYKIGKDYGFKPCRGVWSDCDNISKYLNCVNLSCGYYKAHTDKEYTDKHELLNALEFGISILSSGLKKQVFEVETYNYSDDWDDWDDWDDNGICPDCGSYLLEFADGSKNSGMVCPDCYYEKKDVYFYN